MRIKANYLSLAGIEPAHALAALHNAQCAWPISVDRARRILADHPDGKVVSWYHTPLKLKFCFNNSVEVIGYNKLYGGNAAETVLEELRASGGIVPPLHWWERLTAAFGRSLAPSAMWMPTLYL